MKYFDSKKHILDLDKAIVNRLATKSFNSTLGIVQIGDDNASSKYIDLKVRFCNRLGIKTSVLKIESSLEDRVIFEKVSAFLESDSIGGSIIQLPLPRLSLYKILSSIPKDKDIDCLNSILRCEFASPIIRSFETFYYDLIQEKPISTACVIGDGKLVGLPIYDYLRHLGIDVTLINNYKTGDSLSYDLVVTSVGIPDLVKGESLSKGSAVCDFGTTLVEGKVTGDFDLSSKTSHLNLVSPSPGGMGPLVIRFLVMNFLGI